MRMISAFLAYLLLPTFCPAQPLLGNAQLTHYLRDETERLETACLPPGLTLNDWSTHRKEYRRQLQEMLGLLPMPPRMELRPVVTGRLEHPEFTVEKIQFQPLPGWYATAALFLPRGTTLPVPAILYECGHWNSISNGISFGNKAVYQGDGAWFARNGYACLVLDTVLAGEVRGIHTGTRDHGLWWWNSRGYTPAGAEAFLAIRALDYLSTRPEIDTNRFGITGHSGGGAYSWMITALDDRIKAAAPLAGMADIRSHILDPVLDSHCDCNFFINYYRWDFPQVAALAAPRPVLLGGTDSDRLFNLSNTLRIHDKLRRIYQLFGATNQLGLILAPGGHDETPELQLAVMRWFDRHLKGSQSAITNAVTRFFTPEQMKVFQQVPADAINTNIADHFVRVAPRITLTTNELRPLLQSKVFTGWPSGEARQIREAFVAERSDMRLTAFDFASQEHVNLRLYLVESLGNRGSNIVMTVLDQRGWDSMILAMTNAFAAELAQELANVQPGSAGSDFTAINSLVASGSILAFFAPRGFGLDFWAGDERTQTRIRRRFMLLGQTRDGMRVWDIRKALETLRTTRPSTASVMIRAEADAAVNALYAAVFEPSVRTLALHQLPGSHLQGPDYLGILRVTDIPHVVQALQASGVTLLH